jgi:membrane-bound ClpP family serine protease
MNKFRELPRRTKWLIAKRYALFQVPDLTILILILILVYQWVKFEPWILWSILGLWILKGFVVFQIVWRAYDTSLGGDKRSLIGVEGIVEERLAPSGYIRVHGELWKAEVVGKGAVIGQGEKVFIQRVEGLTLFVERAYPKGLRRESDAEVAPNDRP